VITAVRHVTNGSAHCGSDERPDGDLRRGVVVEAYPGDHDTATATASKIQQPGS
jgi:hypothetical protein